MNQHHLCNPNHMESTQLHHHHPQSHGIHNPNKNKKTKPKKKLTYLHIYIIAYLVLTSYVELNHSFDKDYIVPRNVIKKIISLQVLQK